MAVTVQQLQNRSATAVAERKPQTIFDLLDNARTKQALAAVAGKTLDTNRILKLGINAIHRAPRLAECNPRSVLGAIMASTALGLEFNTPLGHAYLIPYKRRAQDASGRWIDVYDCQFQVGYKGWIVLAYRSPAVTDLESEAIHAGDLFDHMKGSERFLRYRKNLTDRGPLIGSYCLTRGRDDHGRDRELATVLDLAEIEKIRSRSETYRSLTQRLNEAQTEKDQAKAQRNFDEQPWVLWEDDMAAKSSIKKHMKLLPLAPSDLLTAAAQLDGAGDDAIDGSFVDLSALADPDAARSVLEGDHAPRTEAGEDESQGQEGADQRAQAPAGDPAAHDSHQRAGAAANQTSPRQGRGGRGSASGAVVE